jgi:hypothetical protein
LANAFGVSATARDSKHDGAGIQSTTVPGFKSTTVPGFKSTTVFGT